MQKLIYFIETRKDNYNDNSVKQQQQHKVDKYLALIARESLKTQLICEALSATFQSAKAQTHLARFMPKLKIKEVIEQWIILYQDLHSIKKSLNVKQEGLQESKAIF